MLLDDAAVELNATARTLGGTSSRGQHAGSEPSVVAGPSLWGAKMAKRRSALSLMGFLPQIQSPRTSVNTVVAASPLPRPSSLHFCFSCLVTTITHFPGTVCFLPQLMCPI